MNATPAAESSAHQPSLWEQIPTSTKWLGAALVTSVPILALTYMDSQRQIRANEHDRAVHEATRQVESQAIQLGSALFPVALNAGTIARYTTNVNLTVQGEHAELLPFLTGELGKVAREAETFSTNSVYQAEDPQNRALLVKLSNQTIMAVEDYWNLARSGIDLSRWRVNGSPVTNDAQTVFVASVNQVFEQIPALRAATTNLLEAEERLIRERTTRIP